MASDETINRRLVQPTTARIEIVVGYTKKTILIGLQEFVVPEFFRIEDVL